MPRKEQEGGTRKRKRRADRVVYGRVFDTDWEAALFILVDSGITLKSFIEHVLQTKVKVSRRHNTIPEKSYWKYLIFRDQSVDEVADVFKTNDAAKGISSAAIEGNTGTSSSRTSGSDEDGASSSGAESLSQEDGLQLMNQKGDGGDGGQPKPHLDSGKLQHRQMHNSASQPRKLGGQQRTKVLRSTSAATSSQRKLRKVSNGSDAFQERSSSSTEEEEEDGMAPSGLEPSDLDTDYNASEEGGASKGLPVQRHHKKGKRGPPDSLPMRDAPEYEGKVICTVCHKRGSRTSLGRLTNSLLGSTRKGYYYCRNSTCPRKQGKRYIGWLLEDSSGDPVKDDPGEIPASSHPPGPEVRQIDVTMSFTNKSAHEISRQMEKLKPNDQGRSLCRHCNSNGVEIINEDLSVFICNQDDCPSIKLLSDQPLARVIGWAVKKAARCLPASKQPPEGGSKEISSTSEASTLHSQNMT